MKKYLALVALTLACPLFAADAPPPSLIAAAAPVELARVDATAEGAAKLAQYEKALAIIIRQRTEADAAVRDWQLQCALLTAENETLKKQCADLSAKVSAAAEAPKPKAVAPAAADPVPPKK